MAGANPEILSSPGCQQTPFIVRKPTRSRSYLTLFAQVVTLSVACHDAQAGLPSHGACASAVGTQGPTPTADLAQHWLCRLLQVVEGGGGGGGGLEWVSQ
jgi:hypothetical protein